MPRLRISCSKTGGELSSIASPIRTIDPYTDRMRFATSRPTGTSLCPARSGTERTVYPVPVETGGFEIDIEKVARIAS